VLLGGLLLLLRGELLLHLPPAILEGLRVERMPLLRLLPCTTTTTTITPMVVMLVVMVMVVVVVVVVVLLLLLLLQLQQLLLLLHPITVHGLVPRYGKVSTTSH
jgi:hypothetical protein